MKKEKGEYQQANSLPRLPSRAARDSVGHAQNKNVTVARPTWANIFGLPWQWGGPCDSLENALGLEPFLSVSCDEVLFILV